MADDVAGTSEVVRDRGRESDEVGREVVGEWECWSKGVLGEEALGVAVGVGEELASLIVWYVRTGRRSTTDLGALQRRRRMRDRRRSRA
jgi:hypothetical protein